MSTAGFSPGDPLVLAWALSAVGGGWWDCAGSSETREGEMRPEVFEEMMAIIARMLGGSGTAAPRGETRGVRLGGTTVSDPHAVGRWMRDRARLHPGEEIAIVCREHELSYLELNTASSRLAGLGARARAPPGERVAVLAEERFCEQVVLLFACAEGGLIFFPMGGPSSPVKSSRRNWN